MTGYFQIWKRMLLTLVTLIVFSLSNTEAYVVICSDESVQTNTINGEIITEFKVPGLNLDPTLCTHYVYKSIFISSSYKIEDYPTPDAILNAIQQMKRQNNDLKILVGVKGLDWLKRPASTEEIVDLTKSLNQYLFDHTFDGVELSISGPERAKGIVENVAKSFKEKLSTNGFTFGINYQSRFEDGSYDWVAINELTDFIVLPTTDLSTSITSPNFATHPHPLKQEDSNLPTVDSIVATWTGLGIPTKKLVITIPTVGQRWRLSSDLTKPPAPSTSLSITDPDYFTELLANQPSYHSICQLVGSGQWEIFDELKDQSGPYIVSPVDSSPRYWIGYDDPRMASIKAEYIVAQNLFGAYVIISPSIRVDSSDDYDNSCGGGLYPITTAVSNVLMSFVGPTKLPLPLETTTETATEIRPEIVEKNTTQTLTGMTTKSKTTTKITTKPKPTVKPTTKSKTTVKLTTKPKTTQKPTTKSRTTTKPTTKPKTTPKLTTKPKTTKKPTAVKM